ncbi:ATP-dependent protease La, variant 2 [Coprinopsis cinerea AmutBmut pab1-1]|nr:ATP-dependent protease La, variant 2 [Coprinopsis cinerea AmutBmut pab1-1]
MPTRRIPRGLKMRRGYALQPPRFDFGWALDDNTMYAIANRCGFPAFHNEWTGQDKHGNPGKPLLDCALASERLHTVLTQRFPELMREFDHVGLGREAKFGPIRIETVHGGKPGLQVRSVSCIVLTDSRKSGNRRPKQEHTDTLREFFGIGKSEEGEEGKFEPYGGPEPLWWLDAQYPIWTSYDSRLYEIENRWLKERY